MYLYEFFLFILSTLLIRGSTTRKLGGACECYMCSCFWTYVKLQHCSCSCSWVITIFRRVVGYLSLNTHLFECRIFPGWLFLNFTRPIQSEEPCLLFCLARSRKTYTPPMRGRLAPHTVRRIGPAHVAFLFFLFYFSQLYFLSYIFFFFFGFIFLFLLFFHNAKKIFMFIVKKIHFSKKKSCLLK
jgi:hypothetical protein